jgi:hypothetical protein
MTDQVTTEENKSIFDGQAKDLTATPAGATNTPEVKPSQPDYNQIFADQLKNITDDNGEQKYKDVPTALEALRFTQQHIRTLEDEHKELRTKATAQETMDKALQNMSAQQAPETTKSEGVNADEIENIALSALDKRDKVLRGRSNMEQVNNALVEQYGGDVEKAKQAFATKASEVGLSVDDMVALAAKSPTAALAYFGTKTDPKPGATKSSINPQATLENREGPIDYTARYLSSSSPALSKWREAGSDLNNGN